MLMIDQENIRKAIRQYRDRWRTFRYWTVVEIAVMTAAGIGCVGLSANEDWHFYYEGTVEQAQTVNVPVETTEEEPEVFVTVTTEDPETANEERGTGAVGTPHEYGGIFPRWGGWSRCHEFLCR